MRKLLCFAVLVLLLAARPASANLIVNGGFETGDFSGWTQFNDTTNTGVTGTFSGVNPPEGSFQAFFGQPTAGFIRQAVQLPTETGQNYTISFSLANLGAGDNQFKVKFEDTFVYTLIDAPEFSYTTVTINVVAPDERALLGFVTKNSNGVFLVDNVKMVKGFNAVPEPSSFALVGAGALSLGLWFARRRKAS